MSEPDVDSVGLPVVVPENSAVGILKITTPLPPAPPACPLPPDPPPPLPVFVLPALPPETVPS